MCPCGGEVRIQESGFRIIPKTSACAYTQTGKRKWLRSSGVRKCESSEVFKSQIGNWQSAIGNEEKLCASVPLCLRAPEASRLGIFDFVREKWIWNFNRTLHLTLPTVSAVVWTFEIWTGKIAKYEIHRRLIRNALDISGWRITVCHTNGQMEF